MTETFHTHSFDDLTDYQSMAFGEIRFRNG